MDCSNGWCSPHFAGCINSWCWLRWVPVHLPTETQRNFRDLWRNYCQPTLAGMVQVHRFTAHFILLFPVRLILQCIDRSQICISVWRQAKGKYTVKHNIGYWNCLECEASACLHCAYCMCGALLFDYCCSLTDWGYCCFVTASGIDLSTTPPQLF